MPPVDDQHIGVDLRAFDGLVPQQLADDLSWSCDFSMADMSIARSFYNAGYARYEVDAKRWPKLASLINRVKDIPQVKAILDKEAKTPGLN